MSEEIKKAETIKDVNKEFCERLEQLKSRSGGVKAFIFLVVDEKKNRTEATVQAVTLPDRFPHLVRFTTAQHRK